MVVLFKGATVLLKKVAKHIEIITSLKYDNEYVDALQITKNQLDNIYMEAEKLLVFLKNRKNAGFIYPFPDQKYDAFLDNLSKFIDLRCKTHLKNYLQTLFDIVKNKYNTIQNISFKFGYKTTEIISLCFEIEEKLDIVMDMSKNMIDGKY